MNAAKVINVPHHKPVMRNLCLVFAIGIALPACDRTIGKTAFHVTIEAGRSEILRVPRAITFLSLASEKCVLLSDAAVHATYDPHGLYTCTGKQYLSDGRSVEWEIHSNDGRTMTNITIDSNEYDLSRGRLFILSAKSGERTILQVDRDATALTVRGINQLVEGDPEIAGYFGP